MGGTLIGRADDLATLRELLERGDRLVTITGIGGVGKTALARDAAGDLGGRWADGATVVDLTGVARAALVPLAIAGALAVPIPVGRDPLEHVVAALRHRSALLVLDNYEHLLDASDVVTAIWRGCPGVTSLVTSRAALRVPGETTLPLAPLATPPAHVTGDDAVREYPAVALFVDRARASQPDFATDPDGADVRAASDACRRLEGLPLAIELAAAQMRVLSIAALLDRLRPGDRAALRTIGRPPPSIPERHRSLWATVDGTHELLDERARRVFRRLSVFEDPFTLDGMEAVALADEPASDEGDLVDVAADLVDLGLLAPAQDTGPGRFRMLTFVRDYAAQQLATHGERDHCLDRLAAYVADLARSTASRVDGPEEQAALDALDAEPNTVRSALAHLRATGRHALGLQVAVHLAPYWTKREHLADGLEELDGFLAALPSATVALRDTARMWRTRLRIESSLPHELDATVAELDACIDTARRSGDASAELWAISTLGDVYAPSDDPQRVVAVDELGLRRSRELGADWWRADFLRRDAFAAQLRGDAALAASLLDEALLIARRTGNERLVVHASVDRLNLAEILAVPAPDVPSTDELLEMAHRIRHGRAVSWLQMSIGVNAAMSGDLAGGARAFREALLVSEQVGHRPGPGFALMGFMGTAVLAGNLELAARLHGALLPHLARLRVGMPTHYYAIYESFAAEVEAALPADPYDRAVRVGGAWALADAIAAALAFDESLQDRAEDAAREVGRDTTDPRLTDRELEVLDRIAAGDTNKDIARRLGVSPKTVMHHTMGIYRKLGVRGRAEATAYAMRNGLVSTSGAARGDAALR